MMVHDIFSIKESKIYPGLWVAKDGRVFSFKKNKMNQLKTVKARYEQVTYSFRNKRYTCLIHRAVAECFCEGFDVKKTVNHKDFNTLNNSFNNLEWLTQVENICYRDINKRTSKGESHYRAKFSLKDIEKIKSDNRSSREIAKDFLVSHSTIARIKSGATWA